MFFGLKILLIYYVGMRKIAYYLIILLLFINVQTAHALSLEYGNIISINNTNVILEYSGIATKQRFMCRLSTLSCVTTKKKHLPDPTPKSTEEVSLVKQFPAFTPEAGALTYLDDIYLLVNNTDLYYIANSKVSPYVWSLYKQNLTTQTNEVIASSVSHVDTLRMIGTKIIFYTQQKDGWGPAVYNTETHKINSFKIPTTNISTSPSSSSTKDEYVVTIDTESGVLMKPSNTESTKTYPLIIWLHGGPQRQASFGYHPYHSYGTYDSILELLRKNKVFILKLDYRGSIGYGQAYSDSIRGSVGAGDVEDVMNAVAYMKTNYHIKNTYLVGNSYGGYLSLRTIVEHPDTFAGAMSINGVTDWESLLARLQTSIFNVDFGGLPDTTTRGAYDQASILSRISNLGNQNIQIIAGVADKTIPVSQAHLIYDAMTQQKKNVNLVLYKGEGHVYKKPKTISDLCRRMFKFVGTKVDTNCNAQN
jgi:dipeptidyl aminopeptidase/acylaminoacyl peptidase